MKIDDLTVRYPHDVNLSRIKATGPAARSGFDPGGVGMKDTARTSALARVASEALQQLQGEMSVREEKVDQFRQVASDDFKLSDEAIDAIFSKLLAT